MVKHLASSLVDVLYIFDEPSIGLHPRDVHRLNELLQKLRDKGNTVIVVEHDRDVIKIADHVVDVGPHAGNRGGNIVYEGTFANLQHAETLTGRYMKASMPIKEHFRPAKGKLTIANATLNNLQNVSVDIPIGVLDGCDGCGGFGQEFAH
jgi:excinuclease UvrABC ATPase subunit